MPTSSDNNLIRLRWTLRGQVQGVGFRPFVYRLARRLNVSGFVRNDSGGVTMEIQASEAGVEAFRAAFAAELPALARVDERIEVPLATEAGERAFYIADSDGGYSPLSAAVTIDTAICPDCLRELFDPADRRRGYGLINCTNCGPRLTIIRTVPYDRPNTTMAAFPLCPACAAEYADPLNRRFHAQPTACPACGPRIWLQPAELTADSPRLAGGKASVYHQAAQLLEDGQILAIKSLGGFHIAVRADSDPAVARLRQRKHRDAKPFALMCRNLDTARQLVDLSEAAVAELTSPRAPIILAPIRPAPITISPLVAPHNHRLGVMLPNTPIHHLLFAALDLAIPALVMTSGNFSDEPICIDNAEAVERLSSIADAFLLHDRPIQRPVDDSVLLDAPGGIVPVRRSRGYAPGPFILRTTRSGLGSVLAVGPDLKNTIAVTRRDEIILSQHVGDLSNAVAVEHYRRTIADFLDLFRVAPQYVAHDLHPSYTSTQIARELAATWDIPLIGVQHHHAHAAAILAEHRITGPALALVCDGTGYGPEVDGTFSIWGSELLRVLPDGTFTRLARLKPFRLPGGDAAAKDTRRPALALLYAAFGDSFESLPIARQLVPSDDPRSMLAAMILRGFNSPWTSSTGRVFDAVAAILGVCTHNHFEAQAGLTLEALAHDAFHGMGLQTHVPSTLAPADPPLFTLAASPSLVEIDLAPLIRHLVSHYTTVPASELALLFHHQLASAFAAAIARVASPNEPIALTGGVFCNQLLATLLHACLPPHNRILTHHAFPPNDGAVAFGQAVVALQRIGT